MMYRAVVRACLLDGGEDLVTCQEYTSLGDALDPGGIQFTICYPFYFAVGMNRRKSICGIKERDGHQAENGDKQRQRIVSAVGHTTYR